jgi:3-hydroxymyristoyl/3-hydroxydecanoyl-(acyl carrier protein) dehydratase
MLVQVRSASFREWARPDQQIDIHADVTSSMPDVARASCRAAIDGRDIAVADLLFAFVPYARLADGYRDDVLERYLAAHPERRR